jgi:hypothetical protein
MLFEHQDPSLVQIMVFRKTRPAAPKEYITLDIVIHFYFIRFFVVGDFSKYSFMKFSAIYEFY